MKKLFVLFLTTLFLLSSCSLIGYNTIKISIPAEYIDQIDKLIVSIANGDAVDEKEIEEISEEISFTHFGFIDVIMAYAYNAQGVLLFTGKGGKNDLNIELDYAGANAASHIVIFQDGLPWGTTSMQDMLLAEGFTEGDGENQYEFVTSDEISGFGLNPYTDLLIIANDQAQTFYDVLGADNGKINDFVYSGGTVLWEVCDNGWAYGDIKSAGIELPGGIEINLLYEYYNTIMQPDHKMFDGITLTELYNNYASHEYFTLLPAGTNVLMNGSDSDQPTLVVYPHGAGIVFMTGQPLEHAYIYNPESMGLILPRLVKLVLGKL
ncbi:MAG: hypothetical protein PHW02_00275 [bacterium]|nr:hypothetical protein [bacterium]